MSDRSALTRARRWVVKIGSALATRNCTPAGELLGDRLKSFADQNNLSLNVRIKSQSGPAGLLESLEITSLAAPSAMPATGRLPASGG